MAKWRMQKAGMKTDPPVEGRARSLAQDCLLGLGLAGTVAGLALLGRQDLPALGCLLAAGIFLAAWLVTRHLDTLVGRLSNSPEEKRRARLQSIEDEEKAMRMEDILRRRPRLPKDPTSGKPIAGSALSDSTDKP